jgi:hypothetical protein
MSPYSIKTTVFLFWIRSSSFSTGSRFPCVSPQSYIHGQLRQPAGGLNLAFSSRFPAEPNSSTELLLRHELAASPKPRGSVGSPQIASVQPPLSHRHTGSWPHTAGLQPPWSVRRTRSSPENRDFAASAEFAPQARPQQCTCYMKLELHWMKRRCAHNAHTTIAAATRAKKGKEANPFTIPKLLLCRWYLQ